MDSPLSDIGLLPSDNYPAWQPAPDKPKTVYMAPADTRMESLFDQYESQHYKAYVRTKEDE